MLLSYVYKLRPINKQSEQMSGWLDMLRSHYNWCLVDRINTYNQQFIQGEYCDLKTKAYACPLTCFVFKSGATGEPWKKDGTKRTAGLIQDAALPELKKARPWYKSIASDVLQRNVARLNTAYQNFFSQNRGFPKFKNRSNFKSFEYKPGRVKISGHKVYLPAIGWMRFFNSRVIPEGFSFRTVTIRKKADGWYMSVRIEDESVPIPAVKPLSEVQTVVGLDMGLTKLVHCSDGSDINNPRFATNKKSRRVLKIRQRRVSRKKKGSCNRRKENKKVAQYHSKITDKRSAHQWQVANRIVKKADCIAIENLNIAGMIRRCKVKVDEKSGQFLPNGQSAKRALNRSISDASWGELISKIEYAAAKSGKVVIKVNPRYTSQTCSACGVIDKESRAREKFICTSCGHIDHADKQAARNIKAKAVAEYGLILKKVRRDSAEPLKGSIQLALWETPTPELTGGKRRQPGARKSKRRVPGNLIVQLDLFSQDILGSHSIESPFL